MSSLQQSSTPSPPVSREVTPVSAQTARKISAAIEEEFAAFTAELGDLRDSLAAMDLTIGQQEDKVRPSDSSSRDWKSSYERKML